MALNRYIDATLDAPISIVRRQAVAIAVCAAASIGAIFYLANAAALALEPSTGAAAARLIIGVAFLVIAGGAIYAPRLFRKEGFVQRAQAEAQSMTREEKMALIVEAILAGFSLTSRRSQGRQHR